MIDSSLGAGPQMLEGPGTNSGSVGAYPLETFKSPLLDITKPISGVELLPARPGYIPYLLPFLGGFSGWIIEKVTGTQTSPPTIQAGSNAAHTNTIPTDATTPSNANVNASTPPTAVNGPGSASTLNKRIPNAPVFLDITVPAAGTGGYSCMAHLIVGVIWVSVG